MPPNKTPQLPTLQSSIHSSLSWPLPKQNLVLRLPISLTFPRKLNLHRELLAMSDGQSGLIYSLSHRPRLRQIQIAPIVSILKRAQNLFRVLPNAVED